ncbi:methyltransferase domain-containing protein [Geodermatophilus sp. SYSU D00525]
MTAGLRRVRLVIGRRLRGRGLTGVVHESCRTVGAGVRRGRMYLSDLALDLRLGVRTRGLADNEASLAPQTFGRDPHAYEPVHADWWRRAMSALPPVHRDATFVDLGTGRGRPLVLAARMGFRRIVGVELDPALVRTAERNARRWSRRDPGLAMTVVHADAATYPLPDGPLVVFMANPFGAETLRRVLDQVVARRGRGDVVVVYFNPLHADVFDEYPSLEVHDRGPDWAVYRLPGPEVTG